jgi:hypothetical protein
VTGSVETERLAHVLDRLLSRSALPTSTRPFDLMMITGAFGNGARDGTTKSPLGILANGPTPHVPRVNSACLAPAAWAASAFSAADIDACLFSSFTSGLTIAGPTRPSARKLSANRLPNSAAGPAPGDLRGD